ncbi:mCG146285, partial [Mus musculus]
PGKEELRLRWPCAVNRKNPCWYTRHVLPPSEASSLPTELTASCRPSKPKPGRCE